MRLTYDDLEALRASYPDVFDDEQLKPEKTRRNSMCLRELPAGLKEADKAVRAHKRELRRLKEQQEMYEREQQDQRQRRLQTQSERLFLGR